MNFDIDPSWHYKPLIVLFVLQIFLLTFDTIRGSIQNISKSTLDDIATSTTESLPFRFLTIQSGAVILSSATLTTIVALAMRRSPQIMMHTASIMLIVLSSTGMIITLIYERFFLALVSGLTFLITLISYLRNQSKIHLSGIISEYSFKLMSPYPSLVFILIFSVLGGHIYGSIANLSAALILISHFEEASGLFITIMTTYLTLSILWTFQTIECTLKNIVAGVVATEYSQPTDDSKPASPVGGLLKRSFTCSFGSICYAATLLSTINSVRDMLYLIVEWGQKHSQPVQWALDFSDRFARRFNSLAFNRVALYNTPFGKAAPQVWDKMKDTGTSQIFGDTWISTATLILSWDIAIISAILNSLIGLALFKHTLEERIYIFVSSMFLGYIIPDLTFKLFGIGTTAAIVSIMDNFEILNEKDPELHKYITSHYPDMKHPT